MGDTVGPKRVLILGGTSEARELAQLLHGRGIDVTSSLAGRVANPALPVGSIRIGGFGGPDGLARWVSEQRIALMVDATHPFASRITDSAMAAARRTGIGLVGVRRPGWVEAPGEEWHRVTTIAGAATLLQSALATDSPLHPALRRVFLTTGRRDLDAFTGLVDHWFLIRSVDPPTAPLPPQAELVLARGPYTVDGERHLMQHHRIEVLVTKDSGGPLTAAKLVAARELGVTVIMVDRPPYPLTPMLDTAAAAADWVCSQLT